MPNGVHDDDANPLAKFAVPSPLTSASLEPDGDEAEARGDGLRSGGSEVQPEDEAWDELSDAERRAQLENVFSGAVDELEAGRGSSLLVAQAEGALSQLRAQMYSTARGRKEHEALEERLSKVSEGRKYDVDDEK